MSDVINDTLGGPPIVLVLADGDASFFAYERPNRTIQFALSGGRLVAEGRSYDLGGRGDAEQLKPVFASQEFWHSWRTFHPSTETY